MKKADYGHIDNNTPSFAISLYKDYRGYGIGTALMKEMLNFLTANDIRDMAGLDEKLQSMIEKQFSIREELRPIDRRLKTLDKHIEQVGYYLEFKPFTQTCRQMKPKQQAASGLHRSPPPRVYPL